MTKEETIEKIKEILSKDTRFNTATIKINFKDKVRKKSTLKP